MHPCTHTHTHTHAPAHAQVPHGAVFNLELDPPAPLCVSGLELVALGQDSSAERREGVDPASDGLWGWGWRDNPERARRLAAQEAREAARRGQERAGKEGAGRRGWMACVATSGREANWRQL